MTERFCGFPPVCDEQSRLLILGSFPSVKSRAEGFYYGNPQNRFWRTVCGFFGEEVPPTTEGKRAFLLQKKIALWDIVDSCSVVGSADASISGEVVSNVPALLRLAPVSKIYCNGSKAFHILAETFPDLLPMTERLPSTSPANPRFSEEVWRQALSNAGLISG